MNLIEIKLNDLLCNGMVYCIMLGFFFDFVGGFGGFDNIVSDFFDLVKFFF